MNLELTYPALVNLLSGGFNQDYEDVFGDAEDVIAMYTSDPVFCARLPGEAARLLAEREGPSLDAALTELHNGYPYYAHGQTAMEFLEMVVDRAHAAAVVPEGPLALIVGQPIRRVDEGPPATVIVGELAVVFTSGMKCSSADKQGRSHLEMARSTVGHEVVWAGKAGAGVTVATATARMFTPPRGRVLPRRPSSFVSSASRRNGAQPVKDDVDGLMLVTSSCGRGI